MLQFKVQVQALMNVSLSVENEEDLPKAIESLYFSSDKDGVEIHEQMDEGREFWVRNQHGMLCSPDAR